jgi:8-oxo-dGTP pyrophosphatase MutT (NUDIX family)
MPGVGARPLRPSSRFFRLEHLRQLRGSEQVAAVCYRIRKSGIEFLLVKTSGGRWIFPKGSAEPGLTHAQAAALEAFEEAGVHGRMDEASFTSYARRKKDVDGVFVETAVNVHLCEVLWLDPPREAGRNPTWFSAEKTKRRLVEDRSAEFGAELVRVVDGAVSRILRAWQRGA